MIGTGLAAPLVLPLVLWVRSSFTAEPWWEKTVREVSVILVAGPAAGLSYWHTYNLMSSYGVPWYLAAAMPLSADGVATISTLALHRAGPSAKPAKSKPDTRPATKAAPAKSLPEPAPATEIGQRQHQRAAMVAWLEGRDPARAKDEIETLKAKFGCSARTAHRVRADAGRVAS